MIALALLICAADSPPAWRASAGYGIEALSGGRPAWQAAALQLGHRQGGTTLVGEALLARRFDLTDEGVAIEAYQALWRRASGSLRVQVVPNAQVLPGADVAADLYQGLPRGWEAYAGYRRMAFRAEGVDIMSAGLGRYVAAWYLRGRLTLVPRGGTTGVSGLVSARHYGRTADDWWEIGGGLGQELITVGAGQAIAVHDNNVLLARLQHFFTAATGITLTATYNGTTGFASRTGVSAGITRRF